MTRLLRLVVVVSALYVAFPGAQPAAAQRKKDDVVTLKDGRVIRGTIVEMFPNDSTFLMRLPDGSYVRHNKSEIAAMGKEAVSEGQDARTSPKKPAQAWFWSFVVPGGGQLYNGDVAKGVTAATLGALGLALYFSVETDRCDFYPDDCAEERRTTGAVIFLAAWLASQIEAPIRASAINRKINQGVTLHLAPQPHALGLSLVSLAF